MPNFLTPRAEGERMDMAEILLERSRQEVEYRLRNHPLGAVEVCDEIQQIVLMWDFNLRSAVRDGATIADHNHAERSKREHATAKAFMDLLWETDEGRELADLVVSRKSGKRGLVA